MVLVDPEFRRQGIGATLLARALSRLDVRGVPCDKLDATSEGKPLHEKLGFQAEYEIERWMLSRRGKALTKVPAPPSSNEVFELDRNVFGADRSALLMSFAEQAPELTLVERSNERVSGYAFGRKGSEADHLGPWVARDGASVSKLLDRFLNRSSGEVVFVDLVKANAWAERLLAERGFRLSRALTRMFQGENLNPGQPDSICAIAGPEFG